MATGKIAAGHERNGSVCWLGVEVSGDDQWVSTSPPLRVLHEQRSVCDHGLHVRTFDCLSMTLTAVISTIFQLTALNAAVDADPAGVRVATHLQLNVIAKDRWHVVAADTELLARSDTDQPYHCY